MESPPNTYTREGNLQGQPSFGIPSHLTTVQYPVLHCIFKGKLCCSEERGGKGCCGVYTYQVYVTASH
jgi:hypothetical protein